jgi:hypothetical protein
MNQTLISNIVAVIGVLLGTSLGYFLSVRANENNFRRTVLREIAFEYRRLANSRIAGHVQGLIQAGILQCESNKEFAFVLSLVDDLNPQIEIGDQWRPKNGNYLEFFALLKRERIDSTSRQQLVELKNRVENA